jgi:putative restriction endonuclease
MNSGTDNKFSRNVVPFDKLFDAKTNYVLNPSSENKFWVNISEGRIKSFVTKFNENFSIILRGDPCISGDFYAIPFTVIKTALVDKYRTYDKTGRKRWVASIRNHQLRIGRYPTSIDVALYYGNAHNLLPNATTLTKDDENDYAIQNRTIEIQQRQKQSLFRKRVLKNFNSCCCITGFTENELLIASHIVPWQHRIETRLNPSNGLLLFAGYDKMFDQGFFTLDDDLTIIVPDNIKSLSSPLQKQMLEIADRKVTAPLHWEIKHEFLEFHRREIFGKRILTFT